MTLYLFNAHFWALWKKVYYAYMHFLTHIYKVLFVNYLSCKLFYISIIIYYVNKIFDYYFTNSNNASECERILWATIFAICNFIYIYFFVENSFSSFPIILLPVFNFSSRRSKKSYWKINWIAFLDIVPLDVERVGREKESFVRVDV